MDFYNMEAIACLHSYPKIGDEQQEYHREKLPLQLLILQSTPAIPSEIRETIQVLEVKAVFC